jgi:(S)-mandelate dehydrogenase
MPWSRNPSRSRNLALALNIADLREIARRRVPGLAFEYLEGGADDEITLHHNRQSLASLRLIPQTLVNTEGRVLHTHLFSRPCDAPLVIAPTGLNGVLHQDGDIALARAAARFGIPFTLSTVSTTRLEDVARQANGRLWMQLYVMQDRAIAKDIMQRADSAGYEALVFTTDANEFGNREWNRRIYRAPGKPTFRSMLDIARHPGWLLTTLVRTGIPTLRNIESFLPPGTANAVGGSTVIPKLFKASITWDDIEWIRRHWPKKLLVKGILSVADAKRAAAMGCDGIVLSNHGGRQLDCCVSPIEMLPEVRQNVGDEMTLIVDSGFRRGSDVIKALALGADVVMIGRATLYGLAAGGQAGVHRALEILTSEIDRVLGQMGCRSVAELRPEMVRKNGAGIV